MQLSGEQAFAIAEIADGTPVELGAKTKEGRYLKRTDDGLTVLIASDGTLTHIGGPRDAFDKVGEQVDAQMWRNEVIGRET